ncbi:MAG: hypothetical protein ACLVB5_06830 [Christensenellales bacterium]
MSLGMILLVVLALLILFGVLQRVLDRMALTDRQALLLVALVLGRRLAAGYPFGNGFRLTSGGALAACCLRRLRVYLCFFHAAAQAESESAVRPAHPVASRKPPAVDRSVHQPALFPADPVAMPFDPMVLYGRVRRRHRMASTGRS